MSAAKVFMGDGASGFLGFSFAALPVLVAEPTPADLWLKINLGVVLETLRGALGIDKKPLRESNDALRELAGSWTEEDAKEFDDATASFEQIDEALWR